MDPFGILGVAASIMTCVQLTRGLLKRVGPSDHSKKDLNAISIAICGFQGAYEGLKTYLQLHEEDETRLSALQHLEEPLRDCKRTLDLLEKRLKSTNFVGQYMIGTLWDAKLKRGLKRLQDAKKLFEIALHVDQRIILSAVERYVRNVAEDVQDLATHINENGKRLLKLDEYSREQSERINAWHGETDTAIHVIRENLFAHGNIANKRHTDIADSLHRIEHHVTDQFHESRSKEEQNKKDEILRWLSSTDPTINQSAAWNIREPETGKWFVCGKDYSQWKETPQSFLWIYGIANCGKTVLSSTIIQDLVDYCNARCTVDENVEPTHSLAYFYFSFTDIKKQNSHNLISSLLAQLVRKLPSIPRTLSKLYGQYQERIVPMDDMKVDLQCVVKLSGQTFLIIDALDECPIGDQDEGRSKVLALLTELSAGALPNLHVLVTSREEPDIDKALAPLVNFSISIQTSQVQPDIYKYIKSQLANDLELKKWSSLIKEEIENALVEQAHGMYRSSRCLAYLRSNAEMKARFRWVSCQIDSLKRCIRPIDVRNALKSLPKTLDDYYARTLLGIDESYRQLTIKALQWLAFSKRPLLIEELAEAVLIDPQATPSFDPAERLFDSHDILKVLSSLITVHTREKGGHNLAKNRLIIEEIKLAHFSVKEYLISNRPKPTELSHFFVTEIAADQLIAESCLLYMKSFAELVDRRLGRPQLIEFPLMQYAGRHWRGHVRRMLFESSKAFADLVFEFFNSKSKTQAQLLRSSDKNLALRRNSKEYTLFHHACRLGLDHTVQQLLELKRESRLQSREIGTTLIAVVVRGHETILDRLLNAGADVNSRSEDDQVTPLWAAAATGHEIIVDRLLKARADVDRSSEHSGTALQAAARQGHKTVVDILLKVGADVNRVSGYYGTALQAAATYGYETIVDRLLEAEAHISISSGPYGTALHAAAIKGHKTIVDRLLKAGANISISSVYYGTAFDWPHGYETIVDRLLKAGADISISSAYYGTALQAAVANRRETIVDRLLKAGADVNISPGYRGTALQVAAENEHETIVDILLRARADVNRSAGDYDTALQKAARNEHELIVDRLLKAGLMSTEYPTPVMVQRR